MGGRGREKHVVIVKGEREGSLLVIKEYKNQCDYCRSETCSRHMRYFRKNSSHFVSARPEKMYMGKLFWLTQLH